LVCLINQATRLAQFFLASGKQYDAELCLGVDTDTQDRTGQVVHRRTVPDFTEVELKEIFSRFVGDIEQIPPTYSALKHKGVALYKLARRGRPVQKPARNVRIEKLQIKTIALPMVRFSVTCSAGTYIRTLCADIGQALGCGGHLSELRRTVSSGFSIGEAISMEALTRCVADPQRPVPLIPPGEALRAMPALKADQAMVTKMKCGGAIDLKDFTDLPRDATVMTNGEKGTYYKVLDNDENLIAVVSVDPEREKMVYCGVFA
jgi:tRNA pseudouridine55 synthase